MNLPVGAFLDPLERRLQLTPVMEREILRILMVDGCQLNAWLVGKLVPPGVSVDLARSFDRARTVLRDDPPHAAILNMTPCDLPWDELASLCRSHTPPIPFLWCSTVFDDPELANAHPGPDETFCYKPVSVPEMRRQIEELVKRAQEAARTDPDHPGESANTAQIPVV